MTDQTDKSESTKTAGSSYFQSPPFHDSIQPNPFMPWARDDAAEALHRHWADTHARLLEALQQQMSSAASSCAGAAAPTDLPPAPGSPQAAMEFYLHAFRQTWPEASVRS